MKTFNKIAVNAYKKEKKIEAQISSGFASTKQKKTLVGLKVLADAVLFFGNEHVKIKKGSIAYFKEDDLTASSWARAEFGIEGSEEKFALAEPNYMVMVDDESQ